MGRTGGGGWKDPGGGGRRGKEPKCKMGRTGGGLYGVYNTPVHYARGPH